MSDTRDAPVNYSTANRPHIKTIICAIISAKRIIIQAIQQGNDTIMSTLEEIQAAQVVTDAKVATVAAAVTALLAKISAVPAAGLTAEQQTAIDAIVAHASKINDALSGVDASVNPAPAI
jgi:hypothetical protein